MCMNRDLVIQVIQVGLFQNDRKAFYGFPPILLGIKERKRKGKKSKRKKRSKLVSTASTGHLTYQFERHQLALTLITLSFLSWVIMIFFSRALVPNLRCFHQMYRFFELDSCSLMLKFMACFLPLIYFLLSQCFLQKFLNCGPGRNSMRRT